MGRDDAAIGLVLFVDGGDGSPLEALMASAREAMALDLLELAMGCPLVSRVYVATNSLRFAAAARKYDRVAVSIDPPGEPFHFGHRLLELVEGHQLDRFLYFGSAAAPLLSEETLEELCGHVLNLQRTVITNNPASADFFGVTSAAALRRIELPASRDNGVPMQLVRQAGLNMEVLEPAIENAFDVDTPTDLAILKLQEMARPHIRRMLDAVELDTALLERAMPLLVSQRANATLIGRVATNIWGRALPDIPGPKRLFVEERGMDATGRDERGEVRSVIGYLAEAVGFERLFAILADCSDIVMFDTRVVFRHLKLELSKADRFASYLGEADLVQNVQARAFTAAALAAPMPVLMGGRGIVAGSLWALVQEAWNRTDAGLLQPA